MPENPHDNILAAGREFFEVSVSLKDDDPVNKFVFQSHLLTLDL